ncbi:Lipocalin-like domain-containing protein, partial [Dysosmobacter welbionis]
PSLHGRIQRVPEGPPCQTFQILPGGLLALTAAAAAGAPVLQFQEGGTGGSGVPQQKCPDPQALAQPGEQATAAQTLPDEPVVIILLRQSDAAAAAPEPAHQSSHSGQDQRGQGQEQQRRHQLRGDGGAGGAFHRQSGLT